MRFIFSLLFFLSAFPLLAQVTQPEQEIEKDSLAPLVDSKYREDQFYASIAYILVQDAPAAFAKNSLSTGLTAGFLRDMPVNKARNRSVAVGLGYSYNNIKQNLLIAETGDTRSYTIDEADTFDKNKLVLHYLELPLELRWRNSDSISHKFWRVYAGFKVSYLFASKSQTDFADNSVKVTGNDDLNKIMYGTYLSVGWNTWNLYAYYGLNPIFKSATLDTGQKINFNSLNLGLMFYIL